MFRQGLILLMALCFASPSFAKEFNVADAQKLFLTGEYQKVIDLCKEAIEDRERDEAWRLYLARAYWTIGRYDEASKAITAALKLQPYSIRLRTAAYPIYRSNGEPAKANTMLEEINELGGYRRSSYRDPLTVVALGEGAVLLGADPKIVLDNFYEPARKADPKLREVYLAIGRLALEKHDYALAAKNLQAGLKEHPDDPEILTTLAEAFQPGDRGEMLSLL